MRRFFYPQNIFWIEPEEMAEIEKRANEGDKDAKFMLGRFHIVCQPTAESTSTAYTLFTEAMTLGSLEAEVELSYMHRYGESNLPVDIHKSDSMLLHAVSEGCELAALRYAKRMIYGDLYTEANPKKALEHIDSFIEAGFSPADWYYLKGCAIEEISGHAAAAQWYLKARERGCTVAHAYAAVALCYDDKFNLVDHELFLDLTDKGFAHNDTFSFALQRLAALELYDHMAAEEKEEFIKGIIKDLELIAQMGIGAAAKTLGDLYRYGEYDQEEDFDKAWKWYARGALYGYYDCYAGLYSMAKTKDYEADDNFKEACAIYAVRYGSEEMLREVVEQYRRGKFTDYAAEIEKYYIAIYDKMVEEEDEPEIDDDGRYDPYV